MGHVVVKRTMVPGLDSIWSRVVKPSEFKAKRSQVVTVRSHQPPELLLGDKSLRLTEQAVLVTAKAVLQALDRPMKLGQENGHYVLDVDVAWGGQTRSRL